MKFGTLQVVTDLLNVWKPIGYNLVYKMKYKVNGKSLKGIRENLLPRVLSIFCIKYQL